MIKILITLGLLLLAILVLFYFYERMEKKSREQKRARLASLLDEHNRQLAEEVQSAVMQNIIQALKRKNKVIETPTEKN